MIVIGCDFMEVQDKIQTSEIQILYDVFNQIFHSILQNYNSLLFAIKDNAGMEAIKMAEEQLKEKGIDISHFPNREKMQYYITHYVQDIPIIARLQQYIHKKEYPQNEQRKRQLNEELIEAHVGLNNKLSLVNEAKEGIQEILVGWATLEFVIENPNRISIATIEQLSQLGYMGTCGTPLMKEMFSLIKNIRILEMENHSLKREIESLKSNKVKKLE